MTCAKRRITFRRLADHRVMVRLPRVWWLFLEFRLLFPRAKPGPRAWTWIVAGKTAWWRLGAWDYRSGDKAAADIRRRERAREDAEWNAFEQEARRAG